MIRRAIVLNIDRSQKHDLGLMNGVLSMTQASFPIPSLPASMQEPLRRFADRIRILGGPNSLAITLFGAIVPETTSRFDPHHDIARSVVVLHMIDLEMLRVLAKDGLKLGKARIAAPLIMTPEYIQHSVDTFPLELLEIQQRHASLFGPDYFADLTFAESHMRLQCERELNTILIGMRQSLLNAAGREKLFQSIEVDVMDRLMRTLRGLVWLHGSHTFHPATQAVTLVEERLPQPLSGIRTALDEGHSTGWTEFQSLYHDVESLRNLADAW